MYEFSQQTANAQTIDELALLLHGYFISEGIKDFSFTYYNQHTKSGNQLIYDWGTPTLKRWHQYYIEQGYADADRTLELLEHSLIPVFWDVQEQLLYAKNKREQRIREESIEFGIDKGLCIPVHGPNGDFAVLVLHQFQGEQGLLDWQHKQCSWIAVTHVYLHFLRQRLLEASKPSTSLTKREQSCLNFTAEGMRTGWIAKQLNISERTVNFHLQNANKKLGAKNKYLAVMTWKKNKV